VLAQRYCNYCREAWSAAERSQRNEERQSLQLSQKTTVVEVQSTTLDRVTSCVWLSTIWWYQHFKHYRSNLL